MHAGPYHAEDTDETDDYRDKDPRVRQHIKDSIREDFDEILDRSRNREEARNDAFRDAFSDSLAGSHDRRDGDDGDGEYGDSDDEEARRERGGRARQRANDYASDYDAPPFEDAEDFENRQFRDRYNTHEDSIEHQQEVADAEIERLEQQLAQAERQSYRNDVHDAFGEETSINPHSVHAGDLEDSIGQEMGVERSSGYFTAEEGDRLQSVGDFMLFDQGDNAQTAQIIHKNRASPNMSYELEGLA